MLENHSISSVVDGAAPGGAIDIELALHKAMGTISEVLASVPMLRRAENDLHSRSDGVQMRSLTEQVLHQWLRQRARRSIHLGDGMFADPSWDMLLTLLQVELAASQVSVSGLCASSGVPPTTALRWLAILEKGALVRRVADPRDGRRFHVRLTSKGRQGLESYFRELGFSLPPPPDLQDVCRPANLAA